MITQAFRIVVILCSLLVLGSGCTSRSRSQKEAIKAFQAGQQQGVQWAEQGRTTLLVRGAVQNPVVRWQPGMRLSQAIVQAGYTGRTDPKKINVTREGATYPIDIRRLLRGQEDPELRPGDLVDIQ